MPLTQSPKVVKVILADDHELVRSGIKSLLTMIEGVEVIAEARDGQELIELTEVLNPDLVLTDISMPRMDGLAAIAYLHASRPEVRLVVLSMYDTADFVKRAVVSGACGYLLKSTSLSELELALKRVMSHGSYFGPSISSLLLAPSNTAAGAQLTERQIEVLKLLAKGQSSKEIAWTLKLSPKTVDAHRARIMERLNITDLANLTRYAIRKGLVDA